MEKKFVALIRICSGLLSFVRQLSIMRNFYLLLALISQFILLQAVDIRYLEDSLGVLSLLQREDDEGLITYPTCNLSDSTTEPPDHIRKPSAAPVLLSRANTKQPLKNPKDDSAEAFEDLIQNIKEVGTHAVIKPDKEQLQDWKVKYQGISIPIGATGIWYPFGSIAQDFSMYYLKGCTGMFLVSPQGVWMGHLWEGSASINGGGSFTRRYKDIHGAETTRIRTIPAFKAIAVDILSQVTAAEDQPKRAKWTSLADLEAYHGNPFSRGSDVDAFVLTKAISPQNPVQMYPAHITELKNAIQQIVPDSSYQDRTYAFYDRKEWEKIGKEPPISRKLMGVVAIQYTPYDHDGGDNGCTPMARARIFYENNVDPVLDKSWPALPEQVNGKRRRDACTSTTQESPPSPITPAPTSTPSCEYLPMDPGHGRDKAACVCDSTRTLPLLTVAPSGTQSVFSNAASCAYTAVPGPSVANPVTTDVRVWTTGCEACTAVGGVADQRTCTTVASCTPTTSPSPSPSPAVPTFAVWVANRTVPIGDAEGKDGGKKLAADMFGKLRGFCADGGACDVAQYAKMEGVETVVKGGEEPLQPEMYWETATFFSIPVLEKMLAAALATWIPATSKSCEDVEYVLEADPTISGCGNGPVKRGDGLTFMPTSRVLRRCNNDCGDDGMECHYKGHICKAPDLISVVMGEDNNPYANHIEIGVKLAGDDSGIDKAVCEVLVDGLTAAAMALVPELIPADAAEEIEFQALCGDMGDLDFVGS
ncbi:hypothetical protein GGR53DRAFT_506076 [Hypoxylon sp. FL1150]|nr:hypothetical protein GGR53DRAFT_506076 [Hypoxylon sp. FL1150]